MNERCSNQAHGLTPPWGMLSPGQISAREASWEKFEISEWCWPLHFRWTSRIRMLSVEKMNSFGIKILQKFSENGGAWSMLVHRVRTGWNQEAIGCIIPSFIPSLRHLVNQFVGSEPNGRKLHANFLSVSFFSDSSVPWTSSSVEDPPSSLLTCFASLACSFPELSLNHVVSPLMEEMRIDIDKGTIPRSNLLNKSAGLFQPFLAFFGPKIGLWFQGPHFLFEEILMNQRNLFDEHFFFFCYNVINSCAIKHPLGDGYVLAPSVRQQQQLLIKIKHTIIFPPKILQVNRCLRWFSLSCWPRASLVAKRCCWSTACWNHSPGNSSMCPAPVTRVSGSSGRRSPAKSFWRWEMWGCINGKYIHSALLKSYANELYELACTIFQDSEFSSAMELLC